MDPSTKEEIDKLLEAFKQPEQQVQDENSCRNAKRLISFTPVKKRKRANVEMPDVKSPENEAKAEVMEAETEPAAVKEEESPKDDETQHEAPSSEFVYDLIPLVNEVEDALMFNDTLITFREGVLTFGKHQMPMDLLGMDLLDDRVFLVTSESNVLVYNLTTLQKEIELEIPGKLTSCYVDGNFIVSDDKIYAVKDMSIEVKEFEGLLKFKRLRDTLLVVTKECVIMESGRRIIKIPNPFEKLLSLQAFNKRLVFHCHDSLHFYDQRLLVPVQVIRQSFSFCSVLDDKLVLVDGDEIRIGETRIECCAAVTRMKGSLVFTEEGLFRMKLVDVYLRYSSLIENGQFDQAKMLQQTYELSEVELLKANLKHLVLNHPNSDETKIALAELNRMGYDLYTVTLYEHFTEPLKEVHFRTSQQTPDVEFNMNDLFLEIMNKHFDQFIALWNACPYSLLLDRWRDLLSINEDNFSEALCTSTPLKRWFVHAFPVVIETGNDLAFVVEKLLRNDYDVIQILIRMVKNLCLQRRFIVPGNKKYLVTEFQAIQKKLEKLLNELDIYYAFGFELAFEEYLDLSLNQRALLLVGRSIEALDEYLESVNCLKQRDGIISEYVLQNKDASFLDEIHSPSVKQDVIEELLKCDVDVDVEQYGDLELDSNLVLLYKFKQKILQYELLDEYNKSAVYSNPNRLLRLFDEPDELALLVELFPSITQRKVDLRLLQLGKKVHAGNCALEEFEEFQKYAHPMMEVDDMDLKEGKKDDAFQLIYEMLQADEVSDFAFLQDSIETLEKFNLFKFIRDCFAKSDVGEYKKVLVSKNYSRIFNRLFESSEHSLVIPFAKLRGALLVLLKDYIASKSPRSSKGKIDRFGYASFMPLLELLKEYKCSQLVAQIQAKFDEKIDVSNALNFNDPVLALAYLNNMPSEVAFNAIKTALNQYKNEYDKIKQIALVSVRFARQNEQRAFCVQMEKLSKNCSWWQLLGHFHEPEQVLTKVCELGYDFLLDFIDDYQLDSTKMLLEYCKYKLTQELYDIKDVANDLVGDGKAHELLDVLREAIQTVDALDYSRIKYVFEMIITLDPEDSIAKKGVLILDLLVSSELRIPYHELVLTPVETLHSVLTLDNLNTLLPLSVPLSISNEEFYLILANKCDDIKALKPLLSKVKTCRRLVAAWQRLAEIQTVPGAKILCLRSAVSHQNKLANNPEDLRLLDQLKNDLLITETKLILSECVHVADYENLLSDIELLLQKLFELECEENYDVHAIAQELCLLHDVDYVSMMEDLLDNYLQSAKLTLFEWLNVPAYIRYLVQPLGFADKLLQLSDDPSAKVSTRCKIKALAILLNSEMKIEQEQAKQAAVNLVMLVYLYWCEELRIPVKKQDILTLDKHAFCQSLLRRGDLRTLKFISIVMLDFKIQDIDLWQHVLMHLAKNGGAFFAIETMLRLKEMGIYIHDLNIVNNVFFCAVEEDQASFDILGKPIALDRIEVLRNFASKFSFISLNLLRSVRFLQQ